MGMSGRHLEFVLDSEAFPCWAVVMCLHNGKVQMAAELGWKVLIGTLAFSLCRSSLIWRWMPTATMSFG